MASPRSSWSGTVTFDLTAIPVTLSRATRDEREASIKTLCSCCNLPVDRSERCSATGNAVEDKIKGVDLGGGVYEPLAHGAYAAIEAATQDDALELLDAQPLSALPMAFGLQTYYVRAKKDDRAAANSLATLAVALKRTNYGAVVKLCKSAKQDLAVVSVFQGYVLLTLIPFVPNFVRPDAQEKAHMRAAIDEGKVERMIASLDGIRNADGFEWSSYENDGLRLRQEAVDVVLSANAAAEPDEDEMTENELAIVGDLMARLQRHVDEKEAALAEAVAA